MSPSELAHIGFDLFAVVAMLVGNWLLINSRITKLETTIGLMLDGKLKIGDECEQAHGHGGNGRVRGVKY